MDAIDRAILRLSCSELMSQKLPPAIIINEAVELAKRYGNEQSPQFINGILENFEFSFLICGGRHRAGKVNQKIS